MKFMRNPDIDAIYIYIVGVTHTLYKYYTIDRRAGPYFMNTVVYFLIIKT